MRDGNSKKSKFSWPKTLVKKWFNIKSKAEDFHADDVDHGGCFFVPHWYRIFVATWNVAGKSPPSYLNLEDWLTTSPPADIYVLGFQEIVPLNAGNVLGAEDNGPARKWLALIRKTLNSLPGASDGFHTPSPVLYPLVELDADFEGSTRQEASSFFHRRSFQSLSRSMRTDNDMAMPQPRLDRRFSVCDRFVLGHRPSNYDPKFRWGSSSDENGAGDSPGNAHNSEYSPMTYSGSFALEENNSPMEHSRYCLVASKQMVGIFLTVWVKSDLRDDVRNLKVSCVGRGLMGYLGNKGSISISMSLHRTSFCFVCSHLTSGQKEGDELRRNSDVMEILRKTRFPRVHGTGYDNSPQTILEHDRVIWLGDLNYRIALSYRSAKALLCLEQRNGRVFEGWNEGKIHFPPTYKYSNNSDRYAGEDRHPKEKRRTPAWCDRILWYGRGLYQLSYVRGESKFSDHRPVYSVFSVDVESINCNRTRKSMNCSRGRIEAEELLPESHGYTELNEQCLGEIPANERVLSTATRKVGSTLYIVNKFLTPEDHDGTALPDYH
ncbi:Type I inositol 1,4,5-trisphosphate 5-phosphatase CVP2 [Hibiscus syriacus]|uniref:Type I inositol 1,4,5-trisphosphate 5-phosphatase CVP2 n=1 Tax=Hibiscus syriacus TaxID=106335 RepID=A0A6A3AKB7_HIBSY|nr:Type I inositol 1,4,5-trisphosphate 5-phosphatase CVP2 [Hibiscus syriacus]